MKTLKTLTFAPLLLLSAVAANVYEPRRLTPEEAKVNSLLPLDDLLTPKNYSEDTINIEKQVLSHVRFDVPNVSGRLARLEGP